MFVELARCLRRQLWRIANWMLRALGAVNWPELRKIQYLRARADWSRFSGLNARW